MRRRIYEILNHPRPDDRVGRAISVALVLLIVANVAVSILETDDAIARSAPGFFKWFEWTSILVFSVEYVLRLWSCTADPRFAGAIRGRIRMAMTPMALVDLVGIAPTYIELLMPGALDLRFLRVLRLLRLFRLLRSPRISGAVATMLRVVRNKHVELAVSIAIVVVAMLLAAGAIYIVEQDEPGTLFTSIPQAMWWSIETITTIGYGDMIPATPVGKVIGSFVAFIGICAVALPVGIVSSGFIEELNRKKHETAPPVAPHRCPHCGGELES